MDYPYTNVGNGESMNITLSGVSMPEGLEAEVIAYIKSRMIELGGNSEYYTVGAKRYSVTSTTL